MQREYWLFSKSFLATFFFSISPVLWRKLPGSKSAGRVQSVALRLICEREAEIEAFQSQEYWSIEAALCLASGDNFTARLTHLDSTKWIF